MADLPHVAPATTVFLRWHLRDPDAEPRTGRQEFVNTRTGNGYAVPHPADTDGATICGIPMLCTDLWTTGHPAPGDPVCTQCGNRTPGIPDEPLW